MLRPDGAEADADNADSEKAPADQRPETLQKVELEIKKGELLAVVGGTGQGKSSLLSAMLGEIPCTSENGGTLPVFVNGSVAYVSQEAWIFNTTVLHLCIDCARLYCAVWYHCIGLHCITWYCVGYCISL